MSFSARLTKRIHRMVGLDPVVEGEYTFFQPGGSDHFIQFFLKNFPLEYWDLDPWDRHNLFLQDLAMEFEVEFELDEEGEFAVYTEEDAKGVQVVRALMDLKQEHLGMLYLLGEARACSRFLQKVTQSTAIHPCYLDSRLLEAEMALFETLEEVQYFFEQHGLSHQSPVSLKGQIKGPHAFEVLDYLRKSQTELFNLVSFMGHSRDGSMGMISLGESGLLFAEALRLSSFLEIAEAIYEKLKQKYQLMLGKHLIHCAAQPGEGSLEIEGVPLHLEFALPIEKIEGLLRQFTAGIKPLFLLGNYERLTRGLWLVYATEISTGKQVHFEIGRAGARFYLESAHSIPLMEMIQQYLAKHVSRLR